MNNSNNVKIKMTRCSLKRVMFLVLALQFLLPFQTEAATLYFSPPTDTYSVGDTILLEARLNTDGETVNAIEANIIFSPDTLEFIKAEEGSSKIDLWIKRSQAQKNKISFSGGMSSGYKGENGLLTRIVFKAKKDGIGKLEFGSDSQVLLKDGKGTKANLSFIQKTLHIIRPSDVPIKIISPSHPDQSVWYPNKNFEATWSVKPGARYSYSFNPDSPTEPDLTKEQETVRFAKEGLDDGIYYLTVREKADGEWGSAVSYRIMIDTTPPQDLKAVVASDPSLYKGKYFIAFSATDNASGVEYFEIREGDGEWERAESPFVLRDQTLEREIAIKAADRAGNEIARFVAEVRKAPIEEKKPTLELLLWLLLGAGAVIAIYYLFKHLFLKKK